MFTQKQVNSRDLRGMQVRPGPYSGPEGEARLRQERISEERALRNYVRPGTVLNYIFPQHEARPILNYRKAR